MKESGKFKTAESGNVRREDVVKAKMEIKRDEMNEDYFDNLKKYGEAKIKNDKKEKAKFYARTTRNVEKTKQLKEDLLSYDNPKVYTGDMTDEVWAGKHVEGGPNSYKERTTRQVNDEYNELSKKMQQDDYYYKVEDDRRLKKLRAEYDTLVAQGQEDVNLSDYNKRQIEADKIRKEISKPVEYDYKSVNARELTEEGKRIFRDAESQKYGEMLKAQLEYDKTYLEKERILSGNKGLSQKEMDDISPYKGGKLYSEFTDEEKQLAEELHLRGMAMSAWTYGEDLHTDKDVNSAPGNEKYYGKPYINKFYDELGKQRTEEILKQQREYFDRGAVEKNVSTDSEGLTYNRFIEPIHSRGSRITENVAQTDLKSKYKGTYEYLKNTKNMSGTEILELLKKIDEDKK